MGDASRAASPSIPVLLVTHRQNLVRHQRGVIEALGRATSLSLWLVEDQGWPARIGDFGAAADVSIVIFYVKFRHLLERDAFDWGSFGGRRVMLDLDSCQNFSTIISPRYLGRWPDVVRRNEFHTLVCTSSVSTERFRAEGVPAVWMPKGYDATRIHDEGRPDRHGICSFGTEYLARRALQSRLRGARLEPSTFRCAPMELNDHLNRYAACLICNMEVHRPRFVPPRVLWHLPANVLRLRPGIEPMLKNFEASGAGCAPICDRLDDLDALGFVDGETMVAYSSADEAVERVRYYVERPDELRAIGRRASALARDRHTWDHRVASLLASGPRDCAG